MKKLALTTVAAGVLALTPVAAATTPATPAGKYHRKVHISAFSGALNGEWTIALSRGAYNVSKDGTTVLKGKYSIKGSKISIGSGGSKAFCQATGTYRFKLAGKRLSFTVISDHAKGCGGRVAVLTSGPFSKLG